MPVRVTIPMGSAVGAVLHAFARLVLAGAAVTALVTTSLSALGVLPWLILSAGSGRGVRIEAGIVAQLGVTALLCLLVMVTPSNNRMRALEQSHRDFHIATMDVANAYHAAHATDRTSVFTLSAQFDQMREDLEHLRTHPTLRLLEADMMRMAEPPAASTLGVIQAVPLKREAGKVVTDVDQAREDDAGHAHPNHDLEQASHQLSA